MNLSETLCLSLLLGFCSGRGARSLLERERPDAIRSVPSRLAFSLSDSICSIPLCGLFLLLLVCVHRSYLTHLFLLSLSLFFVCVRARAISKNIHTLNRAFRRMCQKYNQADLSTQLIELEDSFVALTWPGGWVQRSITRAWILYSLCMKAKQRTSFTHCLFHKDICQCVENIGIFSSHRPVNRCIDGRSHRSLSFSPLSLFTVCTSSLFSVTTASIYSMGGRFLLSHERARFVTG